MRADTDTSYTSNQEIPSVSRIEQHESLAVSNIWHSTGGRPSDGPHLHISPFLS